MKVKLNLSGDVQHFNNQTTVNDHHGGLAHAKATGIVQTKPTENHQKFDPKTKKLRQALFRLLAASKRLIPIEMVSSSTQTLSKIWSIKLHRGLDISRDDINNMCCQLRAQSSNAVVLLPATLPTAGGNTFNVFSTICSALAPAAPVALPASAPASPLTPQTSHCMATPSLSPPPQEEPAPLPSSAVSLATAPLPKRKHLHHQRQRSCVIFTKLAAQNRNIQGLLGSQGCILAS